MSECMVDFVCSNPQYQNRVRASVVGATKARAQYGLAWNDAVCEHPVRGNEARNDLNSVQGVDAAGGGTVEGTE